MRTIGRAVAVAAIGAMLTGAPVRADIQVLYTFNFVDARQDNNVGIASGTLLSFGGGFSPTSGTTVTAQQGSTIRNVPYLNSPALPFEFFRSIAYDPSLTGSWTLTATNAGQANSPVIAITPAVGSATAPPFVTNVHVDSLSPTA